MPVILEVRSRAPDQLRDYPPIDLTAMASEINLGRAAENDVVLDDDTGTISKHHCTIRRAGDGYEIVDYSRNGMFRDPSGVALAPQVAEPLDVGDSFRISSFALHVVDMPLDGPSEESSGVMETALDEPDPHRARASSVVEEADESDMLGAVPASYESPGLPDPIVRQRARLDAFSGDDTDWDDGGLSGRDEDDRESDFPALASDKETRRHAAVADTVAASAMVFVQPRLSSEAIPDDWDINSELGGGDAPPRDTPRAVVLDHSPIGDEVFNPATATALGRVLPQAVSQPAALSAFIEAVGINAASLAGEDMVSMMTQAGALLRLSLLNLHQMLGARHSIKLGLGIERTILGRSGNNPLKSIGNPDDAIKALLGPVIPGFLDAREAVEEGFADVKDHHLALVDALQGTLASLAERLAPSAVERKLGPSTPVERAFGTLREARCWRLYQILHAQAASPAGRDAIIAGASPADDLESRDRDGRHIRGMADGG